MHRRPLLRHLATVFLALLLSSPWAPAWSQAASGDARPYLQVESGSHSAFIRRLDADSRRGLVVTASDDKTARVWDMASGELRHVLRPMVGNGELGRLYGVAIHPAEDLVAVGGTTGNGVGQHRIFLFSMTTGQMVRSFDARGGDVRKLAWTRDGSLLLAVYAGDHALRAFDLNGVLVHEQALTAPSYGLAVSADGKAAASSLDGRIVVVTASGGRVTPLRLLTARSDQAVGLSFSPDGQRLVVGFRKAKTAPEVLNVATGRSLLTLQQHDLVEGTQLSVAWSEDGNRITVAGSGYNTRRRFPVFFHDAAGGQVLGQQDVAGDTVFDLVPLAGGQTAWASHDGTWGIAAIDRMALAVKSAIADLKGPGTLQVSDDGLRVGWTWSWGQDPATFDFARRLVASSPAGAASGRDLQAPDTSRGASERPIWQDTTRPRINGRAVDLDPAEVSRALDYFPASGDAALGTSHRLLRIGAKGGVQWQVRTLGEVRSVNVTGDGRMIVSGMSDGTLRWWRASDGSELLALLAARDGRWVAWTPDGYFDAGAGADRLVGWTVNRDDGSGADHFSLNRFRERFNRPELIDRVLQTAAPVAALDALSTSSRTASAATQAPATQAPTSPSAQSALAAPPVAAASLATLQFPPVIGPVDLAALKPGAPELSIPVAIRAKGDVEVEVRVDGRPVNASTQKLAGAAGATPGAQTAVATLPAPPAGSLVQVLAKDGNGVSEPLGFVVQNGSGNVQPGALKPIAAVDQPAVALAAAPRPGGLIGAAPTTSAPATPAPTTSAPGTSRTTAPTISQPRLYVLAIGISDYERREYQLGLAAKDATDFAQAMRKQGGKLYRDVQARTLVNQEATRLAIIANLKWLSDTVGPGDIGMLFLAGHGINAKTGQYYFLPHEGSHEQLEKTGLPEAAIRDTLGRMRGKALFFVDTCFGGNVVGNFSTASRELARMANDLAAAENGVVVFASSSGKQLSEENDAWGNGAFTKAVLAGLSGGADLTRTGRITFKGLDFYISEEVRKLTEGRQTPVTISPIGVPDFAIARLGAV